MKPRLGRCVIALVVGFRSRRYRAARAAARRWAAEAAEQRETIARFRERFVELTTENEELKDSVAAVDAANERLRGELDILTARDRLWIAWEGRERARIDAETARFAAGKTRALDFPQLEPEDRP